MNHLSKSAGVASPALSIKVFGFNRKLARSFFFMFDSDPRLVSDMDDRDDSRLPIDESSSTFREMYSRWRLEPIS